MIRVAVPATSANLGSAFDCGGLALGLCNEVYIEPSDTVDIAVIDGTDVPLGPDNLIFTSAKAVYEQCGAELKGLKIRQLNRIPLTGGLGSSAACIVAGLLAANALLGKPMSRSDILFLAATLEGHPDNVTPALLGGMTVAVMGQKKVEYSRFEIGNELSFIAMVPQMGLNTKRARAALPKSVAMSDAVFNISRSALLASAFASKSYSLLRTATEDRLHQPTRIPLIHGASEAISIADSSGAMASFVSGAGSTVLAIADSEDNGILERMEKQLGQCEATQNYRLLRLMADNRGAVVDIS